MKLSSGQKLIIASVGIAVVAVAVILLLIWPKATAVAELSDQISAAENEIASAQSLLEQRQTQKARSSDTDAQLLALSNQLPENPEMPSLIIELQDTVNMSGLEFISLKPEAPVVMDAGYSAIPSEILVRGRWQDMVDLLQRLRRVTRQIRITEFSVIEADTGDLVDVGFDTDVTLVEATIVVEVYTMPLDVLPADETVPAPAAPLGEAKETDVVDDLTPQAAEAPTADAMPSAEKQGFMSTTLGKVVVIGGAIVAFLVVATLVTFAVITFLAVDAAPDLIEQATQNMQSQTATNTAESNEPDEPAVEPGSVPLSSIFTFRDIFDPLIKPVDSEDATATADLLSDLENIENMEPNTLYLQDVIVENGVSYAVVWYQFSPFTLAEGDVIAGTPWQVLSIYSGSVTMLYGDTQVTLIVGQGVSSK